MHLEHRPHAGMQAPSTGSVRAEGIFLVLGEGHTPLGPLEVPKAADPGPQDRYEDS